jgi:hypothetical protein
VRFGAAAARLECDLLLLEFLFLLYDFHMKLLVRANKFLFKDFWVLCEKLLL